MLHLDERFITKCLLLILSLCLLLSLLYAALYVSSYYYLAESLNVDRALFQDLS